MISVVNGSAFLTQISATAKNRAAPRTAKTADAGIKMGLKD